MGAKTPVGEKAKVGIREALKEISGKKELTGTKKLPAFRKNLSVLLTLDGDKILLTGRASATPLVVRAMPGMATPVMLRSKASKREIASLYSLWVLFTESVLSFWMKSDCSDRRRVVQSISGSIDGL
ncbi:hypothetical protein [Allocoleopsis sp.]|uniref:hypothetical protein n=1 Tax=Allocoleopsis sp. TaxID=3088169 RepID=UPI002FD121C0